MKSKIGHTKQIRVYTGTYAKFIFDIETCIASLQEYDVPSTAVEYLFRKEIINNLFRIAVLYSKRT